MMRASALLLSAIILQGCASAPKLMPTPNTYTQVKQYPADIVKPQHRNNQIVVLYVTDRKVQDHTNEITSYGVDRSNAMAFGVAEVLVGDDLSWEGLVEISSSSKKVKNLTYSIKSRREIGRFPSTPYPFKNINGVVENMPTVQAAVDRSRTRLRELIVEKLDQTDKKDVVLFIHGFNNSFDSAAFTQAGIWHFLGRQGVPMIYSWPAAYGGLLGYFVDRESGEYTVYHLKETLRILFDTPEIEQIHIIAHSRGTDVMTTALRELIIESRVNGVLQEDHFRVQNLILAAPDLDFGVMSQRLMAEKFGLAFGQITIYTTQSDKALGFAQKLMSGVRFGRVKSTDLTEDQRKIFASVGNVSIIQVNNIKGFVGHAYFHDSPAVSSDLISTLSTNAKPGSAERPLIHTRDNFWLISHNDPALQ